MKLQIACVLSFVAFLPSSFVSADAASFEEQGSGQMERTELQKRSLQRKTHKDQSLLQRTLAADLKKQLETKKIEFAERRGQSRWTSPKEQSLLQLNVGALQSMQGLRTNASANRPKKDGCDLVSKRWSGLPKDHLLLQTSSRSELSAQFRVQKSKSNQAKSKASFAPRRSGLPKDHLLLQITVVSHLKKPVELIKTESVARTDKHRAKDMSLMQLNMGTRFKKGLVDPNISDENESCSGRGNVKCRAATGRIIVTRDHSL